MKTDIKPETAFQDTLSFTLNGEVNDSTMIRYLLQKQGVNYVWSEHFRHGSEFKLMIFFVDRGEMMMAKMLYPDAVEGLHKDKSIKLHYNYFEDK